MAARRTTAGKHGSKRGLAPAVLAAAVMALALPGAGLAVGAAQQSGSFVSSDFAPFTPANVDPQLARRVAADLRENNIRFTPAGGPAGSDRTITVAVRVDDATARAITIRSAAETVRAKPGIAAIALDEGRFNLGISRGYRSFAATENASAASSVGLASGKARLPSSIRNVAMPDLSEYRPSEGAKGGKPSRFQPRIALETEEGRAGRTPRTLDALGEQSVDVGGAYRISRNLDVTAGVRISQERDRLAPLTDEVQDSQAVYVGTQIRF